jgi:PilZ domain
MSVPAPTSRDLLRQFLEMLPPLPTAISVFAPRGGVEEIMLAAVDAGQLVGYGPQAFMHANEVIAQLRDDAGDGCDVVMTVTKAYYQAGDQALLHMDVAEILDRSGHREEPRAQLSEMARARIEYSEAGLDGHEVEVRLADASERGIAFITDLDLALGDRVALEMRVDGQPMRLTALVYHSEPASFGRNRVGCEIADADLPVRTMLAGLASDADGRTALHRRPDLRDALEQSRADRAALQQRLKPRRY